MIKKLIVTLVILVLCMSVVSASENFTDEVSLNDDEAVQSTITPNGTTFEDIQESINDAHEYDTILLDGVYSGSGNSIIINKSITIQGSDNGATLDANSLSNIFKIKLSSNVILKNLNFINGKDKKASAIYNGVGNSYSATLDIINCSFQNNSAYYTILSGDSNFTLTNCNFVNNEGNIRIGDYNSHTNVSFNRCNFTDKISVYGSLFVENSNFLGGYFNNGGYYWDLVVINNSNFINSSNELFSENILINNCIFKNTRNFEAVSYLYKNLPALAICNKNASFTNNTFINNDVAMDVIWGNHSLNGCQFINNDVAYNQFYGTADISECIFSENIKAINTKDEDLFFVDALDYYLGNFDYDLTKLNNLNLVNSSFSNNSNSISADFSKVEIENCSGVNNIIFISSKGLTTTYASGKTLNIEVVDENKKPLSNIKLKLDVILYEDDGANFYVAFNKTYTIKTDSKGIAKFKASNLNQDFSKYYVYVSSLDSNYETGKKTLLVQINKAPTTVKAPKVSAKFKKSKYFKVTVKNKVTKKVVKSLKVKIKVYTGKKYKTYTVKTDKKGVAKLNTKSLKRGTHKVVISSGNSNYKISAKSTIKIK